MGDFINRLKSRKFLMALGGFLFTVVTVVFEINVSPEQWTALWTFILSFIVPEGIADIIERKNNTAAKKK